MGDDEADAESVDLDDPDVTSTPSRSGVAPPPLPPIAFAPSLQPAEPRKPISTGVLLAAIVFVGIAGAAVVAVAMRKSAPDPAAAPTRVINMPTLEMDDSSDAG